MLIGEVQPSNEVMKSIPEIIKQASSSSLGIFALMIIVIGLLAYFFFVHAPVKIRFIIFSSILLGVALYGFAITRATQSTTPASDGMPVKLTIGGVVVDASDDSGIPLAEINVTSGDERTTTDSNGTFHLEVGSASGEKPIHLRVSKQGYTTLEWQVTPPINGMTIPLKKSNAH